MRAMDPPPGRAERGAQKTRGANGKRPLLLPQSPQPRNHGYADGYPPPLARAEVPLDPAGLDAGAPQPEDAGMVQVDPARSRAASVFRADLPWPHPFKHQISKANARESPWCHQRGNAHERLPGSTSEIRGHHLARLLSRSRNICTKD